MLLRSERRICSVLYRFEISRWSNPRYLAVKKSSSFAKDRHNSSHHVQNETAAESAAPDNCFETSLFPNQKEHRPRELPTMHKPAHPSIQAQGNHGKNPGYDVRQAVSL